jgi:NADPH:quinone reductase-like Zn-dependent oxidoreductase
MGFGFWRPKNVVPGLDLAGVVEEVGPGVTRFAVGDEVLGIGKGSWAELSCAREDKLVHKPESLDFAQAAVLGISGLTALQSLRDAGKLAAGERVLIIGASGGVGSYAVQIARALGAEVTGVCSTAKMELVRSLGAHHVVDYSAGDFTASGERYDLVLDVGGNLPLARLRRVMTPAGRLVFVGGENGGDFTAGFGRPLAAMMRNAFGQQRFAMFAAREHYEDLEHLTRFVREGKLVPSIDRRCTLDEAQAAMRDLEAGRVRGKVAILVR